MKACLVVQHLEERRAEEETVFVSRDMLQVITKPNALFMLMQVLKHVKAEIIRLEAALSTEVPRAWSLHRGIRVVLSKKLKASKWFLQQCQQRFASVVGNCEFDDDDLERDVGDEDNSSEFHFGFDSSERSDMDLW